MIKICHYVRGFFLRKWNGAPRPLFFLPDQDATTNFDSFEAPNEGITPVKASLVQRSITALVSLFGRKKSVRRWQAVNLRKEADGEEEEEAPGSGLLIKILDPEDAAIIIQCMLRRRFALLVRDGKLDAAFQEAQIFWTEEKRVEEELKVAKQTRGKFAFQYVFDVIDTASLFIVQTAAARFIQRIYRRYRAKLLWLKVNKAARKRLWEMQRALLPKSKPVVKSRFTREAHRRVWARTAFAPDGGWPGIVETLTYDLMEFADHPPALGISGLRTLKISLAPGNLGEDYMLCAKRKCWVGIPVYFTPAVSQPRFLQPEHSVGIETRYTRAASPYGQETESVCRIKDTAVTPTRIYKAESRHDQMRKLGWSLQAHDTFDIAQNSDAIRSNGSLNIQAMPFIDISARRFRDTNSTRDQTFLDNASKTFSRIDYRLTSRGGDATGDRSGPLATAAMSAEMYTKRLQSPWGGFISKLFHKKTDRHTNRLKARVGTAVRGAKIHIASSSMNISGVVSDTKNKVPGRKVRQHYRTEFTWLPQTLLSAAVNADRFDRQAAIAIAVAAGSDVAVKQEVGSSVFLTLPQNHFPASDITSFADVEDHIDESACKESNDEIRALEERMMLIEEKINAAKHLEDNKQPEGPFYICGLESSTFSQSVHANGNTHSFHRHSAWPSAQKQIGQLPVRCDHSSGDRGRGISASDKVASSPTTVSDFIAADFSATFLKDPPDGNTPVDEILHPYHWL